jgi:hypothetical protein
MTRRIASAFYLLSLSAVALPCFAAPPFITAAIHWPGGKAQFFISDGTYIRYDITSDHADPGYPKQVTDSTWPGMGAYGTQIVAAFNALDPNKAYFFLANGTYLRYDIGQDRVDSGYPARVDEKSWPGLAPYATQLVGALNWGSDKVQFFLANGTYLQYDLRADLTDSGFPQRIDNKTWPGLGAYAGHIACTINWNNGKAYIFMFDRTYVRYDVASDRIDSGYPMPVDEQTWPGMAGYFRQR